MPVVLLKPTLLSCLGRKKLAERMYSCSLLFVFLSLHQSSTKQSVYPSPIPIAFRQGPYCSSICSFWLCAHFCLPPTPTPIFFLGGVVRWFQIPNSKQTKKHCAPPLPVSCPHAFLAILIRLNGLAVMQTAEIPRYAAHLPPFLPLHTHNTNLNTRLGGGGGGVWSVCRTISCI